MGRRLTDAERVQRAAKTALTKSTEKQFDTQVRELIHRFGWRWAGFHKTPIGDGKGKFITPVRGNAKGWPDMFLIHPTWRRHLWIELKASDGTPKPEQLEWLWLLDDLGLECHLLYPRDLMLAGRILSRPQRIEANHIPARPAPRLTAAR